MRIRIIIVLATLLFVVVQVSECKRKFDLDKLSDSLKNLRDKLNKRTTPRPRPLPTIPTPRWKVTGRAPVIQGYGSSNPAAYGPPPLRFHSRGGGVFSRSHYTTNDTGNTPLGFFLADSLGKIPAPTYFHYNTNYDRYGYIPKYDHYSIHHYFHNEGSIPREVSIHPDTIVTCIGGTSVLCPANTTSFCTNNGALLCVTSISSTAPCPDGRLLNCVRSTVPRRGCKGYGSSKPAAYGPPPLRYHSRGGGGFTRSHYTTNDTGTTPLGFFLADSLGKIPAPTYFYYNTNYDRYGYIPKYDHYSIHHYFYNEGSIPREVSIHPDTIVTCIGGTSILCPANTTSFCSNNGALLCVTSISSTAPCPHDRLVNCVRSTVPCKGSNSTECGLPFRDGVSISIPCVSIAKVSEHVGYNSSSNPMSSYPNETLCVAVLALPAERELSAGERALGEAENLFSVFAAKALGLDGF